MAGLKQRRNAPLVQVSTDEIKNRDASTADPTNSDEASSTGGSEDASLSTNNDNNTKQLGGKKSSNESLDSLNDTGKMRSLKDRSYIPNSFYIILGTIIGLEYFSGMYCMSTIESYKNTITNSVIAIRNMMTYTKDLSMTIFDDKDSTAAIRIDSNGVTNLTMEYAKVGIIISFCVSLFYIFFLAPFRAGFWTGPRTRKAKLHRYMGLLYLVHYVLAWVEFCTNYDPYRPSYLCHFIAVNGIIQGVSAFISFKVLPELNDPGYYSDKAVLSRIFIHENLFFTTMAVFGSIYYVKEARDGLQSNLGGRIIENIYIFWPYVAVRPWFPVTSFSNAGTTYKGRSEQNKKFYEIATLMVKIFYLWAKYFFGFFINFSVYLNLVKEEHWRLLHGMLLLNAGTVSLSVFLHTLRFKKVLPPVFTMTVYLIQIYLSFIALPIAFEMFVSHPNLCALCIAGLLLNLTRSRAIHGLWCLVCLVLLTQTDIEW